MTCLVFQAFAFLDLGIILLNIMDIIPLEIPIKAQLRVLILQLIVNVSVHLPKAL